MEAKVTYTREIKAQIRGIDELPLDTAIDISKVEVLP